MIEGQERQYRSDNESVFTTETREERESRTGVKEYTPEEALKFAKELLAKEEEAIAQTPSLN